MRIAHVSRFRLQYILFVLMLILGLGVFLAAKPRQRMGVREPATNLADYVGGEECAACHTDVAEAFQKNPHYKTWNDTQLDWSQRGCEACHGPGREHIEAGGGVTKLFNYKEVSAQKISDECLSCHLQAEEHSNFLRNEHGLNTVGCTECHSVHSSHTEDNLLQARMPALCYSCHGEVRAQFNKPFRHKIHEGLIQCTDCHNQHGGTSLRQLRTASGNDLPCYNCHMEKQGPFVFEHLAVRVEGCTICHDPHGSTNARLLKRSEVRFLCLECHSDTVGVPGPQPPGFHNLTQIEWQNCTSCHVEIHGSNLHHLFFE